MILKDDKKLRHWEEIQKMLFAERDKQVGKFGIQDWDSHKWGSILVEEVGEFAQALLKLDEGGPIENAIDEIKQTAMVSINILDCLLEYKYRMENKHPRMLVVNDKHFVCKCGGNVFTEVDTLIFKCNACNEEYKGEPKVSATGTITLNPDEMQMSDTGTRYCQKCGKEMNTTLPECPECRRNK